MCRGQDSETVEQRREEDQERDEVPHSGIPDFVVHVDHQNQQKERYLLAHLDTEGGADGDEGEGGLVVGLEDPVDEVDPSEPAKNDDDAQEDGSAL